MRIRRTRYIISFIFFLLTTLFAGKRSLAETFVAPSAKTIHSEARPLLPHAGKELIKQEVTRAQHCTIQKKSLGDLIVETEHLDTRWLFLGVFFIKSSLLLTDSYLLHIYPSHNFW